MAVYSQYAFGENSIGGITLEADESYIGAIGAYQAMEESYINTHAIFEHVIGCDFAEAMTNHGAMLESDFEAINEASGSGIWAKVAAFFRKLGEKIKGIIQNIIDKITAMCTKDGKTLVSKFEKKILEKLNNGAYTEFKYKWCDIKSGQSTGTSSDIADKVNGVFTTLKTVELGSTDNTYMSKCSLDDLMNGKTINNSHQNGLIELKDRHEKRADGVNDDGQEAINKRVDNFNKEGNPHNKALTASELSDYKDALCAKLVSNSDASSFAKDYDEMVFEDEDEKEGLSSTTISSLEETLKDYGKVTKKLDHEKSLVDKSIRDYIKKISDIDKKFKKDSQTKDKYTSDAAYGRVLASAMISMANQCNTVSNMYFAAVLAAIKKNYKQSRAVYVKAATYNKKKSANEATLIEAMLEVSDYEVDQMMPEC